MAFALTRDDKKRRDELLQKAREKYDALVAAVGEYNQELDELRGKMDSALAAYNDVLAECREFCSDVANQANDQVAEKSDRWQESDRASIVGDWISTWENLESELDDIEIELPDDMDIDETPDGLTSLEEAPERPE